MTIQAVASGCVLLAGCVLFAAGSPRLTLMQRIRERYLDLLGSIYIYNEHRGYTAIDRVLEAVRKRAPEDTALIEAIVRHRADERKHYLMFKHWFERRGRMPLRVDRTCGHIDRFIEIVFRTRIDTLDTDAIVASDRLFERLCQVISLTERRGFWQVEVLLRNKFVRSDKTLIQIFRIIRKDEPAHWAPYEGWLDANGRNRGLWWERLIDKFVHAELIAFKIPVLFLMPRLRRRDRWADADETVPHPGDMLPAE